MERQADGVVYYCKFPPQFARDGGRIARQLLARGFADFFQIDFDEEKLRRKGHGKPYYEGNETFQFNISHCRDAAAVAVSVLPVGIDVESMRRIPCGMVEKCCDGRELSYVFGGQDGRRADRGGLSEEEAMRFLRLWTLKESHVKMTGEGLFCPLHTVNFDLSGVEAAKNGKACGVLGRAAERCHFLYEAQELVMALTAGDVKTAEFVWKEMKMEKTLANP